MMRGLGRVPGGWWVVVRAGRTVVLGVDRPVAKRFRRNGGSGLLWSPAIG